MVYMKSILYFAFCACACVAFGWKSPLPIFNQLPHHFDANRKYTFKKSEALFQQAKHFIPGGVNSPVRAFSSVGGNPIVFDRVKGAYAYDVDGNKYIDFVGSWGPAILGHADSRVLDKVRDTLAKGTSFGAPSPLENVLAKMVIDRVPSVDMVRFTSSGTEACMAAMRVARAFTGRDAFIKFDGCYHGHADPFLVSAGSGVATLGLPNSPGVPVGATKHTLIAEYNNLESVKKLLETYDVAAVILEPVVGNAGFITPSQEFLVGLRSLCDKHGALLIFDEVMTGFRVSPSGAQGYFNITPDLSTFGKVIGGGLPVGAYGGRKDVMSMVAPAGPVYQAGTLSGNPLAMAAGIETLRQLSRESYTHLNNTSQNLVNGLIALGREYGHEMCGGAVPGMFGFFFCKGPVRNFREAKQASTKKFASFHRMMLERGVYFAPSQFEAGFVSLAHSKEDIEYTMKAAREVFKNLPK